jgi:hypothetical protein
VATQPTKEQVEAFLSGPPDEPVVMLNMLSFKEQATGELEGLSGREAVWKYSVAMKEFVEARGGTFVLAANIDSQVIGEGGEHFQFVGIMRYPSRVDYVRLAGDPEVAATIGRYRESGLESQWLFAMTEVTG